MCHARFTAAVAFSLLCALFTAACGGHRTSLDSVPLDHSQFSLEKLHTMPAPDGVDMATWNDLKAGLESAIRVAGSAQSGTVAPHLPALEVSNLTAPQSTGSGVNLSWSCKVAGDYDGNGVVSISDLAPLGKYLGA